MCINVFEIYSECVVFVSSFLSCRVSLLTEQTVCWWSWSSSLRGRLHLRDVARWLSCTLWREHADAMIDVWHSIIGCSSFLSLVTISTTSLVGLDAFDRWLGIAASWSCCNLGISEVRWRCESSSRLHRLIHIAHWFFGLIATHGNSTREQAWLSYGFLCSLSLFRSLGLGGDRRRCRSSLKHCKQLISAVCDQGASFLHIYFSLVGASRLCYSFGRELECRDVVRKIPILGLGWLWVLPTGYLCRSLLEVLRWPLKALRLHRSEERLCLWILRRGSDARWANFNNFGLKLGLRGAERLILSSQRRYTWRHWEVVLWSHTRLAGCRRSNSLLRGVEWVLFGLQVYVGRLRGNFSIVSSWWSWRSWFFRLLLDRVAVMRLAH